MPDVLTPTMPRQPLSKLWSEVEALPRADKVFLMERLQAELDSEVLSQLIPDGQTIEIWSPYNATDAESSLLKLLEAEKDTPL